MLVSILFSALLGCSLFGEPEFPVVEETTAEVSVKQQPNILLLSLDTTRADHMRTYGYPRLTTPNLDELARKAIVFENAYAPAPVTLPSHVSIFTGTAPTEHGVITNVLRGGERFLPSEKLRSFAVYANETGYQTSGFVSGAPIRARMGMAAGFDYWNEMPEGEKERIAEDTVDAFVEWWGQRKEGPFLSFVHFYDPHNPYRPPTDYPVSFGTDTSVRGWARERRVSPKARMGHGKAPLVGTRHAINGYDAELHYMDSQIGRIFSLLEESGETENTIIIVTADHGEGLGQHDAMGHGGLLWQEQLHVPLIIFSPFHEARRVAAPAWTPDIFPTVLGMIELPNETSWLKQVSGGDMLAGKGAVPFAECIEGRRTLIDQNWKYHTWEDGSELLFNLQDDPHELDDLASTETDQMLTMRAHYQRRQDSLVERSIVLDSGAKELMPEEEVELLRQLGYLDDEHLPEQ